MMDIFKTHKSLISKKVSSKELVQDALKSAKESKNNTFISITEDLALKQANESDERLSQNKTKSFIDGIPYTLKDLFITKDIRTTAGSKILYNYIPPYDGYVSKRLTDDGGVLIGKVGCDEFGMGSTNENTAFGPITNPLNSNHVAGGSSGGTASTLAEKSSMFSMGTDTGGSVRLPANFCGLVGLKPTYGRISRYGQIAYGSSLDQASPMGNTVTDIACILESLSSHDLMDSTNAPVGELKVAEAVFQTNENYLKGKKIGIDESLFSSCDPLVKKSLDAALGLFKENGVEIIPVNLDHLKYCVAVYYIIATSEASSNLARYDGIHYGLRVSKDGNLENTYRESRNEGFGEEVKRRIILGTFSLSSGYYDAYYKKACQVRRLIYEDFMTAFNSCDAIFSPVCASTAFKKGEGAKDPVQMYMNDLYTIPANLAGVPALALPYGKAENDLPTGFQLIGKPFSEEGLLKLGRGFEHLGGKL